jgi:hypothetical protein
VTGATVLGIALALQLAGFPSGPAVTAHPALPADSALAAWVRGVDPGPGVVQELSRWRSSRGAALSAQHREALAGRIRDGVAEAAGRAVGRFREGVCVPGVEVSFGNEVWAAVGGAGGAGSGQAGNRDEARFEGGLVRVEATACFPDADLDPEEALALYTSPELRMEAEPRIRAIRDEEGESCVETRGVTGLLAPTLTCHRIHRFREGGVAAEHSQLVRNPAAGARSGVQDVYLKESLKTFVALPDGGLALHYVNVTRSGDLGRIERWVGSGAIKDGEKRKAEVLGRRLGAGEEE